MAFLRTANALVVHPHATQAGWSKVRTAAKVNGKPSADLSAQASEILGTRFDPDRFLMSHCTIVASVTAKAVPNVKVGAIKEGGKKINRKWAEYLITPETDQWINNNNDSFSREVLTASYRTFIGAQNFLEHVQVEDLSKGRIIDAALRDIGDTLYVDILVATERKHSQLVADIESGRLNGLSMGCSVSETQCTKCGNVAVDETELCQCCKYEKGNYFMDDWGNRRRIAELCGHSSVDDPPGGVTFIEASWVGSPAFTGAVMRNIISPEEVSLSAAKQAAIILSSPPPEWVMGGQQKAARLDKRADFDFGDGSAAPADGEAPAAAPAAPKDDWATLEESAMQIVRDRVEKRIREEVSKKDKAGQPGPEDSTAHGNDSLNRYAAKQVQAAVRQSYAAAVSTLSRTASCDADLMDKVAVLDQTFGFKSNVTVYRAALTAGPLSKFASTEGFLKACRDAAKRPFTSGEGRVLVRLGRILDHHVANRKVGHITSPPDSSNKTRSLS